MNLRKWCVQDHALEPQHAESDEKDVDSGEGAGKGEKNEPEARPAGKAEESGVHRAQRQSAESRCVLFDFSLVEQTNGMRSPFSALSQLNNGLVADHDAKTTAWPTSTGLPRNRQDRNDQRYQQKQRKSAVLGHRAALLD